MSVSEPNPPLNRPSRTTELVCLASAMAAAFFWLTFVSHGFSVTEILDAVYEIQAAQIAHGRLHILPGPESVFYHDILIYHGEYYFYQGLLPSLIFFGLAPVVGRAAGHYLIVFGFFFVLMYFYHKIVVALVVRGLRGDRLMKWYHAPAAALFTWTAFFVIPLPAGKFWFFAYFSIYEQQILFGLAIAVAALYFLIRGIDERNVSCLALGTFLFALASWTRLTWVPLALICICVGGVLLRSWESGKPHLCRLIPRWLLLIGPSIVLLGALFYLNYVRFDSPFDFGVRHQNPHNATYLRNLKLLFSPETRMWNTLFQLLVYYAPESSVDFFGLATRSFSYIDEWASIGFFQHNPQFLPIIVTIPLASLRAVQSKGPLAIPLLILCFAALYVNLIIAFFSHVVTTRYFIEIYLLLVLAALASALYFVPPGTAVLIFVLLVAAYIPSTVIEFATVRADLRTVKSVKTLEPSGRRQDEFFVKKNSNWPRGVLSAGNAGGFYNYAVVGVDWVAGGRLGAKDVFASYMIPANDTVREGKGTLSVRGVRSLRGKGLLLLFVDNRLIGKVNLREDQGTDVFLKVPFTVDKKAPYEVMGIFLPKGSAYLSPKSDGKPVLEFREILLEGSPKKE